MWGEILKPRYKTKWKKQQQHQKEKKNSRGMARKDRVS